MSKQKNTSIGKILIPACEKYANNTELRTIFKLLGGPVASAIDDLLSGEAAKIQTKRFEEFIEQTKIGLRGMQEEKIDQEFLKSEEFFSLFRKIFNRVLETHESGKIYLFKNIFLNSIKADKSKVYYKERFINIVANLSVKHIEILKYYIEREKVFKKENRGSGSCFTSLMGVAQEVGQISEAQVEAFCGDLLQYNLIYDDAIGKYGYKKGKYRVATNAFEFLDFITLEN